MRDSQKLKEINRIIKELDKKTLSNRVVAYEKRNGKSIPLGFDVDKNELYDMEGANYEPINPEIYFDAIEEIHDIINDEQSFTFDEALKTGDKELISAFDRTGLQESESVVSVWWDKPIKKNQ